MTRNSKSIGRRLRFSQLELVHEVAEHGNLAEAAARLHMTRAGVSKAIKDLEQALGAVLFERSRQGMAPTAAGLRVAKHARLLVNDLQHLTEDVVNARQQSGGVLRLGMPAFVGEHVAPGVLRNLLSVSDATIETVQIFEGRLHGLIEQLLRGELDAVLSLYSPRAVDSLDLSMVHVQPLLEVPMVVVASSSMGIGDKRKKWEEMLKYPWILPPVSTHQRRSLDQMFTARGSRPPTPVIESGSMFANVRFAAEGLGLAIVPEQAAAADLRAGRLVEVDVRPHLPLTTVALMHRRVSAIYMETLDHLGTAIQLWAKENKGAVSAK